MNTDTTPREPGPDAETLLLSNEVQLLLSEKRTWLSVLRTGIAVFALPLSVLSVLITTSKLYDVSKVKTFLTLVLTLSFGLVVLGAYLVARAMKKLRGLDGRILELKGRSRTIADLIERELKSSGVAVVVEAEHACMAIRGIRKQGALTVTSALRGRFKTDPASRAEVLSLINGKGR